MFLLVTDAQPGSPHGRCAIKPRSAGDFYVSAHKQENPGGFIHANIIHNNTLNALFVSCKLY